MNGEWSFVDSESFGFDWFMEDPCEQFHEQSIPESQNQLPSQLVPLK
jgi:hypothetical protein